MSRRALAIGVLLLCCLAACKSLPPADRAQVDAVEDEVRKGILFSRDLALLLEAATDAFAAAPTDVAEVRVDLFREILDGYKLGLENLRLVQQYRITAGQMEGVREWREVLDASEKKMRAATISYLDGLRLLSEQASAGAGLQDLKAGLEEAQRARKIPDAYRASFTWLFSLLQATQMQR